MRAALDGVPPERPKTWRKLRDAELARIRDNRWKRKDELGHDAQYWRRRDVVRMHDDGASLRQIARRFGISPATVLRDLRKMGV